MDRRKWFFCLAISGLTACTETSPLEDIRVGYSHGLRPPEYVHINRDGHEQQMQIVEGTAGYAEVRENDVRITSTLDKTKTVYDLYQVKPTGQKQKTDSRIPKIVILVREHYELLLAHDDDQPKSIGEKTLATLGVLRAK